MKAKIVLLFLVLALVIFAIGCKTQPKSNESGGAGTTGTSGTGSSGTSGNEIDLTNIKTLADLVALGKGIVCDVQTTVEGQTVTLKYYFKNQKYKVEGQMQQGSFVYLRPNDGYLYVKIPSEESQLPPQLNCEWFKFEEAKPQEAEQYGGTASQASSLDTPVEKVKWKCYEQSLSDAIFAVPSNACSMEDIMQAIGYPQ